jgi:hypothetical protein
LTLEIYGEEQFFKLTALLEYISQAYIKHGAFVGNAVNVFICAHNRWVIIPDRQIYALILFFALRKKFKHLGEYPKRKFKCVFSDELIPEGRGETACGTVAHITAIFGFMLASLVIQDNVLS